MATDTDVIIIGGGMSGIGLAVQLKRKYPTATFEMYEQSDDIGGTWAVNTYPGCGVDVPSHFYSYSFALNPNWSRKFTMQPEILAYFHDVADRYNLAAHTYLNYRVLKAVWDEEAQIWTVDIFNLTTKQKFQQRSKALVSAVGALSLPNKCEIEGQEDFAGKIFHSAKWDHSFDHASKDIVVLGNGCSATQFVPVISETAKSVTQFARQPHWLLERANPEYSDVFRFAMRWVPGAMRLLRAKIYAELEAEWLMFDTKTGGSSREKLAAESKAYIKKNAPAKYVDALIPKFEVGCKRRVFDTDYLECLHRDNVELVSNDSVARITKQGILLASGKELKADAIVLATGFQTTRLLSGLDIIGKDNISLNDHWKKHNDGLPQAYYGTCVAGFPNFFVMMGPNTTTGHLSVIYSSECQINFALRMLDPILKSLHPESSWFGLPSLPSPQISSVQVLQQAETEENSWIQTRAKDLVWSSGCSNWYVEPISGKNFMIYPSWQWHFWLRSIFINYGHFSYSSTNGQQVKVGSMLGPLPIWHTLLSIFLLCAIALLGKTIGLHSLLVKT